MHRSNVLWIVLLVLVAVTAFLVPGCCSMDKSKIEERLLGLHKNAPVSALGLSTKKAEIVLGGEKTQAEFSYYHAGSAGPGRPTVLLIHGTPSSLVTWTGVVFGGAEFEGLARDCDVWVLGMLGHGSTRTEHSPYSFQLCADWISAFVDVMDLKDVTIAGNSYGGEFVWRSALDRPNRITKVVLMSSSGFPRKDGEWLPEEVKMREMSLARWGYLFNSRGRVLPALQPHFQTPVPAEHLEEVYLVCSNSDNWRCMIDLARDENGQRSGELFGMKQKALLLWGGKDVAYPIERFARLFEKTIPGAKLVVVPDSGHYPQEERPAFVADAIRKFSRGE